MIKTYQLTLAASAKRLSDVYGGPAGVVDAAKDIPYRLLFFQADGADFYLGDATVSTTNWGGKASVTGNSLGGGAVGPFETGPLKLSDFWAVGAGSTIHIIGVPF